MEQYIDKSALVAEIERLKHTSLEYGYNTMQKVLADSGKDISLRQLQNFIDTLEVIEIGVDVGSPKGDLSRKTVQVIDANGNISEVTFDKAQKGEEI